MAATANTTGARGLAAIPSNPFETLMSDIGDAITTFGAVAVNSRRAYARRHQETCGAANPDPKVVKPAANGLYFTVQPNAKAALAAFLVRTADYISAAKVANPAMADMTALLAVAGEQLHLPGAAFVALMTSTACRMSMVLADPAMGREHDFVNRFAKCLHPLAIKPTDVDPGADIVGRKFLNFIKSVVWFVAAEAFEKGHAVLNIQTLYTYLAVFEAFTVQDAALSADPSTHAAKCIAAADASRTALSETRRFVTAWDLMREQIRKRAPTKTAAKPVPKPAVTIHAAETKVDEPAPEVNEPAPEAHEPAPEVNEPAPEADELAPKAVEPAPKAVEPAPKVGRPVPEADESAPKAVEPAPKVGRPAPKADESAPKAVEPAPKAVEPAPKAVEPAPKAVAEDSPALAEPPAEENLDYDDLLPEE